MPAIFREAIVAGDFRDLRCVRLEGDRATRQDLELFRRHCPPGSILANGLGATVCGLVRHWCSASRTTRSPPCPLSSSLLRYYCNRPTTHLPTPPADIGLREIGHFAFFDSRFENTLWQIPLEWLCAGCLPPDAPGQVVPPPAC